MKRGFTIVELLIVIVVIGILAGITVVAYNGIQNKARDAQTEAAMSTVAKMMEMYHTENGFYPAVCGGGDNAGCSADLLAAPLVPAYGNKMPDAYPTVYTAGVFNYVRGTGGNSYAIYLRFNAKPNCKRGVNVVAGWWGTTLPTC